MRAHEIIDTIQEHKVSSYFQRELNIIGRNPEAVYDILFNGKDPAAALTELMLRDKRSEF